MTKRIPSRPDSPKPEPRVISHGASVELKLENVPLTPNQHRPQVATPTDWAAGKEWLGDWAPPFDVVRGEFYREDVLAALTGPESVTGYALPVELELAREAANSHDPNAIRVEISGGSGSRICHGAPKHAPEGPSREHWIRQGIRAVCLLPGSDGRPSSAHEARNELLIGDSDLISVNPAFLRGATTPIPPGDGESDGFAD